MAELTVEQMRRELAFHRARNEAFDIEALGNERRSLLSQILVKDLCVVLRSQGHHRHQSISTLSTVDATQLRPMRLCALRGRIEYQMSISTIDEMGVDGTTTLNYDTTAWVDEMIPALRASGYYEKITAFYCEMSVNTHPVWIGWPTIYDTLLEVY